MVNDTIGDSITRIRNGYMAGKIYVIVPYTRMVDSLMRVLLNAEYIHSYTIEKPSTDKGKMQIKQLNVKLLYKEGKPALSHIERISKPGIRRYRSKKKLPRVLSGLGIAVVSTSKGLMSDQDARKKGIGGEIICTVY